MEPPRPAQPPYVDRRQALTPGPKRAGPARPRAQSGRVLWAVTRGYTGHAPPLCGWAAGQCGDDAISRVADGLVGRRRQNRLLLVWDNASWHVSQAVRAWIKAHNRHVKQAGGCRVVVCPLPVKSPWLNRIEPKWVHGKRAMAEPDRKLSVAELKHRICAYYGCELFEPIAQ